jgi:hypothetical protein
MHHVSARSIAEERIFKDSGDYTTAIGILARLVADRLLACHAFCFMPTHYHLWATFRDVSTAIHKLNRRYAVAFNKRHRRRGHVSIRHSPASPSNTSGKREMSRGTSR